MRLLEAHQDIRMVSSNLRIRNDLLQIYKKAFNRPHASSNIASVKTALSDLKRVGRNIDLISSDDLCIK